MQAEADQILIPCGDVQDLACAPIGTHSDGTRNALGGFKGLIWGKPVLHLSWQGWHQANQIPCDAAAHGWFGASPKGNRHPPAIQQPFGPPDPFKQLGRIDLGASYQVNNVAEPSFDLGHGKFGIVQCRTRRFHQKAQGLDFAIPINFIKMGPAFPNHDRDFLHQTPKRCLGGSSPGANKRKRRRKRAQ